METGSLPLQSCMRWPHCGSIPARPRSSPPYRRRQPRYTIIALCPNHHGRHLSRRLHPARVRSSQIPRSPRGSDRAAAGLRQHADRTLVDHHPHPDHRRAVSRHGARDLSRCRTLRSRLPRSMWSWLAISSGGSSGIPKLNVVTANELHVPLSDPKSPMPTYMKLTSADVMHSFWVPQLGGQNRRSAQSRERDVG